MVALRLAMRQWRDPLRGIDLPRGRRIAGGCVFQPPIP